MIIEKSQEATISAGVRPRSGSSSNVSSVSSYITKPPPYSTEAESPCIQADIPQVSSEAAQTSQTGQAVNNVFIRPRHREPIVGTFIIDPSLKYPPQGSSSSRWERGDGRRRGRRDRHGGWHHHGHSDDDEGEINALFQTYGGGCTNLNIGVTCPNGVSRRARVCAESRGDLYVNLLPSPSDGHVQLEARSSRGDIVLLVPQSYRGAIQLSTHHGETHFLPQLSRAMRTALWMHDKKIIILGGWHAAPVMPTTPTSSTASSSSNTAQVLDDFCKLQAWGGSIYVGFAGEEVPPRPERNFFQRSGRWRWGEEEDDQVSSRGRHGATPLLHSLIRSPYLAPSSYAMLRLFDNRSIPKLLLFPLLSCDFDV